MRMGRKRSLLRRNCSRGSTRGGTEETFKTGCVIGGSNDDTVFCGPVGIRMGGMIGGETRAALFELGQDSSARLTKGIGRSRVFAFSLRAAGGRHVAIPRNSAV